MNVQITEIQLFTTSEVLQKTFIEPQDEDSKAVSTSRSLGINSGAPLFGSVLTIDFYLLICIPTFLGINVLFFEKFTQRRVIPILTIFLFFWAFSLMIHKLLILRKIQKILGHTILSEMKLTSIEDMIKSQRGKNFFYYGYG